MSPELNALVERIEQMPEAEGRDAARNLLAELEDRERSIEAFQKTETFARLIEEGRQAYREGRTVPFKPGTAMRRLRERNGG